MEFGHYTVNDLAEFALAFALFPFVLLAPGYVVGWLCDLFSFRRRRLAVQGLVASVLGVSLCPIAFYYLWRFGSFAAVGAVLAVVWAVTAVLLVVHYRQARVSAVRPPVTPYRWLALGWALWAVVVMLSLVDLQWGERLIAHSTANDYAKHVAVTDAISRTGLPPVNPVFRPGHDLPLFYYYFWFTVCSVVDVLGGGWVGPRAAVQASVPYCGLAVLAITLLFVKFLDAKGLTPAALCRRYYLAGFLLLVSGLDLIMAILCPVAFYLLSGHCKIYHGVDCWNEPVHPFPDAALWVPHHVAGFVACLTGFLLLRAPESGNRKVRVLLAAVLFASSVGLSVWVAFVAALILGVWLLVRLWQHQREDVRQLVVVGVATVLVALPYMVDLQMANHRHEMPIKFGVRRLEPVDHLAEQLGFDVPWFQTTYNTLLLPLNYSLEFGFFALAAGLYWRHRRRQQESLDSTELFLVVAGVVSLLACTFLRSTLRNNDLGWRGMMFFQFVVLLWAIPVLDGVLRGDAPSDQVRGGRLVMGRWVRRLAVAFLAIGVAGNVVNVFSSRFVRALDNDPQTAYALRQCYEWIRQHERSDALVQHNARGGLELPHALYSGRQTAFIDGHNGLLFGIGKTEGLAVCDDLARLFLTPSDDADVLATCRKYDVEALVIKRTDPAWNLPQSWIWSHRPAFENRFSRVIEVATVESDAAMGKRTAERASAVGDKR